jgi:hypothetical protein
VKLSGVNFISVQIVTMTQAPALPGQFSPNFEFFLSQSLKVRLDVTVCLAAR